MKKLYLNIIVFFTLLMGITACTETPVTPAETEDELNRPEVTIANPVEDAILVINEPVEVTSTATDDRGVARVELVVDGEIVRVDSNPDPAAEGPYIVAQGWTPTTTGPHTIQIKAYNTANVLGESATLKIEVAEAGVAILPTVKTPAITPTAQDLPASTAIPSPTSTETTTDVTATDTPTPASVGAAAATTAPTTSSTTTREEPTPRPLPSSLEFEPTGFEPEGRFKEIWMDLEGGNGLLGYPIAPAIPGRNFAYQSFEGGLMFWWDTPANPDFIWVIEKLGDNFEEGSNWHRYNDTWDDDDDSEYSCEAARNNNELGPIRGFGKVWCLTENLATTLGQPTGLERGSGGNTPFAEVQFYQGGVILHNPLTSDVFVLFNQGGWQHVFY